jgi:tetratricopeptide (TPR) repeat protein
VLALHRYDSSHVIQSSNWFSSGASGGGLFDQNLHLVGILTFRLRGGDAHYFAAPAEWLRAMLDVPGEEGYSEVVPDRSQRLAYWQRPVSDQPKFLQAALLQRDEQWPELEAMAVDWARADASDFEPWYLMGVALAQMNHLPEAEHALKCSLAIEPASTAAWAWLAPVYRRQGQAERAAQIQLRLGVPNALPGRPSPLATSAPCAIDASYSRAP